MKRIGLGLPQLLVLALPATIGGLVVWLLVRSGGHAAYAGAVGAVVGMTYGVAVPTLAAELMAEARAVHAKLRERARALGITLSSRLQLRGRRTAVTVTGELGTCPLGFKRGDQWLISRSGRLDRPMCSRAIAGVTNRRPSAGTADTAVARCVCPLGGQMLTLEVKAA